MAPKLTATELDAMAGYWSRYFQFVMDRNRERRIEEEQARRAEFAAKKAAEKKESK